MPAQPESNDIRLEWVDDEGNLRDEIFDLVGLSIGLEAPGKFRQ